MNNTSTKSKCSFNFNTRPFRHAHGKEPRGFGMWAFDFGTGTLFTPNAMNYGDAKKWIKDVARAYVNATSRSVRANACVTVDVLYVRPTPKISFQCTTERISEETRVEYKEAKTLAQEKANATGLDYGIEKLGKSFSVFMLPIAKNRYGRDLRCEVVQPEKQTSFQFEPTFHSLWSSVVGTPSYVKSDWMALSKALDNGAKYDVVMNEALTLAKKSST